MIGAEIPGLSLVYLAVLSTAQIILLKDKLLANKVLERIWNDLVLV
jgi:hypothetical protein